MGGAWTRHSDGSGWFRANGDQVWRSHKLLPLDETRPTRVLVTGSRTWTSWAHLADALGFYWELGGPLTVVHGDAHKGADRMAREWCERLNGGVMGQVVTEERHPADWRQGGGAGFARNDAMVRLGADVCLAYADVCVKPKCRRPRPHPSHGVWDCVFRARGAGIEVVRYQTWQPR